MTGTSTLPAATAIARLLELDRRESRLRLTAAWLMVALSFIGHIGLAWDIQWHADVGRDRFLTPPHLLLYAAIGLSGLICASVVVLETLRARQGALELNDDTTIRVFGVFRAPLGIIMGGFGYLLSAASAPLDDYWHQLYGIDVTLWSPFHMMGAIGGVIGNLGLVFLLASEASRARARSRVDTSERDADAWRHPSQLALTFGIAGVGLLLTTFLLPGTGGKQAYQKVAGHWLFVLPLLVGFVLPLVLGTARAVLRAPLAATLLVLVMLSFRMIDQNLLPPLVEQLRLIEGLPYRPNAPNSVLVARTLPFLLLLSGLALDGYYAWTKRSGRRLHGGLLGLCAALPLILTWSPYLTPRSAEFKALVASIPQGEALALSVGIGAMIAFFMGRYALRLGTLLERIDR